jgi:hypothetical protein
VCFFETLAVSLLILCIWQSEKSQPTNAEEAASPIAKLVGTERAKGEKTADPQVIILEWKQVQWHLTKR